MIAMKKQLFLSLLILFVSIPLFAQDEEEKKGVSFGLGADFVSQYVWRGMSMAGASIQPGMTLSVGGFDLTVWGSTEIGSVKSEDQVAMKEVNLIAMYDFGETGFGIGFMDSWTQKKEVQATLIISQARQNTPSTSSSSMTFHSKSFHCLFRGIPCFMVLTNKKIQVLKTILPISNWPILLRSNR